MKTQLRFMLCLLVPFLSHAQSPVKLSPGSAGISIIGTELSVDYSTNNPSTSINTKANVFDNDLDTYFASYDRSGTWVGLDLGAKHVITKVSYAPRNDYELGANRLLLGVFEGANSPDFGDAIPLLVVSDMPSMNVLTEQTIHCSRAFRYVRYVGPNDVRCNIAELEFYGYPAAGDNSHLYQLTNLPAVVIHTKNAEAINSKDTYIKGFVSFISENGTKIYSDSLDIKGRGHASWEFPKKPYRIKLYNKTNLLGAPAKAKSWTLINNYGDKTLMRNLLAFDLSRRFEMPYTPAGQAVDVFLNGEYKGCYLLCDQIEVDANRVKVTELTPANVTLPAVSGGYLIEIDAYANQEISWFTSALHYIPVQIRSPKDDEIVPAQTNYIREHFNAFEKALFAPSYKDPGTGYRKYLDTKTFIRHFLIGELAGNTDTYWSTYMYKQRNDDKFYTGPVWDFDLAYNNDRRTYPINSNSNWICLSTGSVAYGMRDVIARLLSDEGFVDELEEIYAYYRDKKVLTEDALLQVVSDYEAALMPSQRLNFMRWNIMNTRVHENPVIHGSYEAEVENVRTYIRGRLAWMDEKLNYVPKEMGGTSVAETTPGISVWTTGNGIGIKGIAGATGVEVLDISGKQIVARTVTKNDAFVALPKGMYVARIDSYNFKCIVY